MSEEDKDKAIIKMFSKIEQLKERIAELEQELTSYKQLYERNKEQRTKAERGIRLEANAHNATVTLLGKSDERVEELEGQLEQRKKMWAVLKNLIDVCEPSYITIETVEELEEKYLSKDQGKGKSICPSCRDYDTCIIKEQKVPFDCLAFKKKGIESMPTKDKPLVLSRNGVSTMQPEDSIKDIKSRMDERLKHPKEGEGPNEHFIRSIYEEFMEEEEIKKDSIRCPKCGSSDKVSKSGNSDRSDDYDCLACGITFLEEDSIRSD